MAFWWRPLIMIMMSVLISLSSRPGTAATTGQLYWCDTRTGYAIGGYDPVAYFVDRKARQGVTDFEYQWKAVTWKFVSAANRAVFVRDPGVYAPQYGGYGAEGIAQGILAAGSPLNWLLFENRLFLFNTAVQRAKWVEGTKFRRGKANANWPDLNSVLVRE